MLSFLAVRASRAVPTYMASRNVPYLFDLFFVVDGLTQARPGRFGLDGMLHRGGMTLWAGRAALTVDIHAIRAVLAWKRPAPLQPSSGAM